MDTPVTDGAADPVPPRSSPRQEWLDVGRGLAIVLVVLVHARDWLATAGLDLDGWDQVNNILSGLRMPLFFAVSGMLGSKWLHGRWNDLLSGKVTFLMWVYLAWQPIGLSAALVADRFTGAHASVGHFVVALAATVVWPRSETWFLWALAVYFVLLRAGRRTPFTVQVTLAATMSLVWFSGLVPEGNLGLNGVPKFYLFFLLGAHHRPLLHHLARTVRGRPLRMLLVVTVWLVAATWAVLSGADTVPGVGLATRALGLAAGIALAVALSRIGILQYLGARTLPIYLAHTPMIILLSWAVHDELGTAWVRALDQVLPLAVTAVTVPLTLLLFTLVQRTPARFLYAPPQWVTSTVRSALRRVLPAPSG